MEGRIYMEDRVGMIVQDSNSISTYHIYNIWFHIYLPNCLGYGLPGPGIQPSGPTLGWPPCSFPLSPRYVLPMVPDIVKYSQGVIRKGVL
jgi:hypothetical protein